MTVPRRPAPPWLLLALSVATLALAAACGGPPGPKGWAPARPVRVDNENLVLVAHRSRLYALTEGSGNPQWQFPPKDKQGYPVSELARERLADGLEIPSDVLADLQSPIDDLTVEGPSRGALKDAIKATTLDQRLKSELNMRVDRVVANDKEAISGLQAFYGDIGVSGDGQTVYVPSYRGIVFALETSTGRMRWWFNAGDKLVGGVAVDGETLYFGSKNEKVYALDAADGTVRWKFDADGEVWATPTLDGDAIYVTSLDGVLHALDRQGEQKWAFREADSGIGGRAVAANGAVYVGAFDNNLYALNAADGSLKWFISADNWFWATPLVQDGTVYAASLDGNVYAVDAASGDKRWDFDAGAPVRSAPVLTQDALVVAARDGTVFKLDPSSGEPLDGGVTETQETILADLAKADDDVVYAVPSGRRLLELNVGGSLGVGVIPLPE